MGATRIRTVELTGRQRGPFSGVGGVLCAIAVTSVLALVATPVRAQADPVPLGATRGKVVAAPQRQYRASGAIANTATPASIAPHSVVTTLPTSGYSDDNPTPVVDPATGTVFVPYTQEIVVMSPVGQIVTTIDEVGPVMGLAINQGVLYALVAVTFTGSPSDTDEIIAIDATTLASEGTVVSAQYITGISLVFAGGYLWTVGACDCGGTANPIRIDPSTGAVTYYNAVALEGPELFAAPNDPDDFFATNGGNGPNAFTWGITRVAISAGTPSATVTQTTFTNYLGIATVTTDDTTVIASDQTGLVELDAGTLQPTGITHEVPGLSDQNASSVAASTATGPIAEIFIGDQEASVFSAGAQEAYLGQVSFGFNTYYPSEPRIVFSPDASTFYVEGQNYNDSTGTSIPAFSVTDLGLTGSPTSLAFDYQRVGTYGAGQRVVLTNVSAAPISVTNLELSGGDYKDFFGNTNCTLSTVVDSFVLAAGASCDIDMYFSPTALGARSTVLGAVVGPTFEPISQLSGTGTEGYFIAGSAGEVGNFGDAAFAGDMSTNALNAPIVSLATTPNGSGYWLLGQDGGIFSFGNAGFYGSTGNIQLNQPVVGLAPTPDGGGYWLVASDGGIFSFGDAAFYGSTGNIHLNKPIVGMAATPDGKGYWLVASDGGIFSFGDAQFYGSTGNIALNKPIVGMAATPDGKGYWLVASDGGIFAFGDARFYGSTGNIRLNQPIVGMAATPDGSGYWLVASDGGIFSYGDAPFLGSLGTDGISTNDVIGIAGTAPPL